MESSTTSLLSSLPYTSLDSGVQHFPQHPNYITTINPMSSITSIPGSLMYSMSPVQSNSQLCQPSDGQSLQPSVLFPSGKLLFYLLI